MRRCCTCKVEKPDDAFTISRTGPGGRCRRCKECRAAYYQANAEKVKARVRANRDRDPEKKRQRDQLYYQNNREQIKQQTQARYEKNRDRILAYHREYAQQHPEKVRARKVRWYQSNPDKWKASVHRRRARKRAGGSFTHGEWRALCEHYGNRCLCCGRSDVALTVDHIVPLSLGGRNDTSNLQPLCLICNLRKARKTIDYRNQEV